MYKSLKIYLYKKFSLGAQFRLYVQHNIWKTYVQNHLQKLVVHRNYSSSTECMQVYIPNLSNISTFTEDFNIMGTHMWSPISQVRLKARTWMVCSDFEIDEVFWPCDEVDNSRWLTDTHSSGAVKLYILDL